MNERMRQEIRQELAIDKQALKEGKWVRLGNTKLHFLVRPATAYNKEFQAMLIKNNNYKLFEKLGVDPDAILKDDEMLNKIAELLLGSIILDIKKDGVSKEDLGTLEVEDLVWFIKEYDSDFAGIIRFVMNRQNFAIIEEQEAKN